MASPTFDATQALEDVSLTLYPGEIHTLLGENGAGKSTLIKIMTGIHQPDRGEILLDGRPIKINDAANARTRHRGDLSRAVGVPRPQHRGEYLISHQKRGAVVNWPRTYKEAEAILETLGVQMDVRSQARGLTLAEQQTVEIAKAISLNVRVLIMDERPRCRRTRWRGCSKIVRTLREQNVAVLFISHRMDEVFEISDRITIFRDGRAHLDQTCPRSDHQ